MQTSKACLLVCAIALLCGSAFAQAPPASGFLSQLQAGVAGEAGGNATGAGQGSGLNCDQSKLAPVNVIVESVTPVPAGGEEPRIVLRNTGGQLANITGWRLFLGNSSSSGSQSSDVLYIADNVRCRPNGTLPAGSSIVFTPKSDRNPCGFPFNLSATGSVTLSDYNDTPKSQMIWDNAAQGTQIHVPASGTTALRVPASKNVLDVLKSLGNFETFLLALQTTGLDQNLSAASDPNYAGPSLPQQQFVLDLPWWFFGSQPAAAATPAAPASTEPSTPPPIGIPPAGPYTILAPTDDAFDKLLVTLGGANGRLPLDALLRQPALKDILLYHIVPGRYSSAYLRNNTPIYTAKGVEVVPIVDGCQTNGKIAFHDSCVDKPTGDNFTCAEQRAFGKCDFPFMVSPLAAQWQGGFCQRTCQRCDCSPGSGVQCAISTINDIDASNGIIQGIGRVLFPPPIFTKEQAIKDAIAFNESVARNQSMGLPTPPGFGGLTGGPGMGPAAPSAPGAPGAPGAFAAPGLNASNTTLPPPAAAPVASPEPAAPGASPAAAAGASPAPAPGAAAGASPAPTDAGAASPAPAADATAAPSPSPAPTDAGSTTGRKLRRW